MIPFREKTPIRRLNPTKNPSGNNWATHKPDLKVDFNHFCGYCHSYDGYRHTYFEVDHFVPKDFIKRTNSSIGLTQYNNLVYSCKFCNNKKLNKWPSQSDKIHNNGKQGFVDPCDPSYEIHFYRTDEGAIRGNTDLGKWMLREAFKFDERERAIIVLWNLNKLREIIDSLIEILNKHAKNSNEYETIKSKLFEYTFEHYFFQKELIEFYDQ